MKCRNCGLPRADHLEALGERGQRIWKCPDGSGTRYPAPTDVELHLHFRAGVDRPWVASWNDKVAGDGEGIGREPLEALEAAAKQLEHNFETEPEDLAAIDRAIKER